MNIKDNITKNLVALLPLLIIDRDLHTSIGLFDNISDRKHYAACVTHCGAVKTNQSTASR